MEKLVIDIMVNAKKDIIVIRTLTNAALDIAKKVKCVSDIYICRSSLKLILLPLS